MEKILIHGGKPLNGTIKLSGAKNSALPIIASAILCNDDVVLKNVPTKLNDIQVMFDLLRSIGASVQEYEDKVVINGKDVASHKLPVESSSKVRSSLILLGILLAKVGKAEISFPGGCKIGERKYDLHIDGLRKLGAKIDIGKTISAQIGGGLAGADIEFYLPTTTGTQNVVIAACKAKGRTSLKNANTRPENQDFFNYLSKMGAKIDCSNRYLEIEGGAVFQPTEHTIMPGSDEMITYIIMAAVTGGEIKIENASLKYEPVAIKHLRESGVDIFEWGDAVYVSAKGKKLEPLDIATAPWPGINSDFQPLYSVHAAACNGESTITDMRFTDRFQYVEELKKFGIDIVAYGNCAVVKGPGEIRGCRVQATDLRGGAAMITTALMTKDATEVSNIYQIDRGYEEIEKKLSALGADIKRVSEPQ